MTRHAAMQTRGGRRIGCAELAAGALGAAASTIAYRELSSALVDDGTFTPERGFSTATFHGDVLMWTGVVLAGAAVVLALVARRRHDRPWARGALGCALFGAGLAWFAWSSVEMHVLGAYDWANTDNVLGDLLYHGGGALVAGVGWVLVLPALTPGAGTGERSD
jgi:hypothetical protein